MKYKTTDDVLPVRETPAETRIPNPESRGCNSNTTGPSRASAPEEEHGPMAFPLLVLAIRAFREVPEKTWVEGFVQLKRSAVGIQ